MDEKKTRKVPGTFALYWSDYGKAAALVKSPYLWCSLFFTAALFPRWTHEGWWEDVLTVIPSILGFSLAAYAMVIAFGNERFVKILATPMVEATSVKPSVYATTGAAFVHFILVQMLALGMAMLCKAWYVPLPPVMIKALSAMGISKSTFITATHVFWFSGFLVFIYAIGCGIAATMRVFRLSRWFAALASASPPDKK